MSRRRVSTRGSPRNRSSSSSQRSAPPWARKRLGRGRPRAFLDDRARTGHVLTAPARQAAMDAGALADEARLRQVVAAAEAYLGVAAPAIMPVSFSFEEDREHACLKLVAAARANGTAHRNVIDRELCLTAEFEEVRRLARDLTAVGEPPFALTVGEKAEQVPNLQQAVARIMAQARKGLEIQRYKGLGEMNPGQLWETTMNPATRTLLQVKIEDAVEADIIFSTLMGDEVEPRRKFIEENALNARNLDI